eukprot:gb/GFBE01058861.1/.p1 GENE.gb/GFBE01058861.1/~~gb/GFBE01058861.1/.p1  ORF type:complete len:493 (+),score=92.33 gb/GFBE01058861.1/:1-1479(+)
MFRTSAALAGACLLPIGAAGKHAWPNGAQSAFVHLFEWSWKDIAIECEEWLGPKGFSAVQISPPMEHIQGDAWWTRYQPVTYNLTSRSGSEKAFVEMVERCANAGVAVYADAVFNHVAGGQGVGVAGSQFGDRSTPLYSKEDFHNTGDLNSNCGVNDYQDKHNVQYCDLDGLPDLCTKCPSVQKTVVTYLNRLLEIGVQGFRVDAAKHQDAGELTQLLEMVDGGLPYVFQEVISGAGEAVTPNMYTGIGQVTEFNYARQLSANVIDAGKLQYLKSFGESWGLMDGTMAIAFIDNHDTQRGEAQLTYKSGGLYTLANIFMLAHPYGYPKVMSSYYFNDNDHGPPSTPVHTTFGGLNCADGQNWVCEHRRPEIANMIAWRAAAGSEPLNSFVSSADGNGIGFCRGAGACVALNRGTNTWKVTMRWTLAAGSYPDVLRAADISDCPVYEVGYDGSVDIEVPPLSGVALYDDSGNFSKVKHTASTVPTGSFSEFIV